MADLASGPFGYTKVNPAQRKYFPGKKGKHMKKEVKRNIPGMSVHPVVNCNEAMRKQSQNKGEMRGGEKKDIKGRF